ncbi:hypothetical protein K503DRAFT_807017 [Rhizopogon vinicolor AM-OR11-026]|uniref:Uncharacterized protein n=1 Tax=Rhizopogon vinicolor AM-OR11-026 TaxID=1314800 RepID=A0A1B7MDC6_9AGAM|nr:hypothetical protein K503DRAFT_807017 [Rhizopogon vinicolor AM-OR11-026]
MATTLLTLRDKSLRWLVNGYHAINKPDVVKQSKSKRPHHVIQPRLPLTYIATQCCPVTPSHITSSPIHAIHISPFSSPITVPIDLP